MFRDFDLERRVECDNAYGGSIHWQDVYTPEHWLIVTANAIIEFQFVSIVIA